MDTDVFDLPPCPRPTPGRPLQGLTILVVEDSRFASEALRLLAQKSGARLRRADCLASARRHLGVYRPGVAIVDLGLPDGSGLDLLAEMAEAAPRIPVLLGSSGDDPDAAARAAVGAGADGFLPKPVESLAAFQACILAHLPAERQPLGPRPLPSERVAPDPLAFRDDLGHAMRLLHQPDPPVAYLRTFLAGLARTAHDPDLRALARDMPARLSADARRGLCARLADRIDGLATV